MESREVIGKERHVPRIEEIIADDPRLPPLERQVLNVLEKNPDYLFRMDKKADLQELGAWMKAPETPYPPMSLVDSAPRPISLIEHALNALHHKEEIGYIIINDHRCYGSHEALGRAKALVKTPEPTVGEQVANGAQPAEAAL